MEGLRALKFKQKKIVICVPMMNERLMGLEWHQGEYLITSLTFLSELTL